MIARGASSPTRARSRGAAARDADERAAARAPESVGLRAAAGVEATGDPSDQGTQVSEYPLV